MTSMLNLIPRTFSFLPERDIFDRFFEDWSPELLDKERNWIPAFDISENDKEYTLTAEMPGIDAKDLDITISDGILTVKGEKKREKEDKGENYHRVERSYGSFQRSFHIPEKVKTEKVDATFKDGILKLILEKDEKSETKKITVK
jgi:HSP20 family protein